MGGGTGAPTFEIHHLSSRELLRTVIQKKSAKDTMAAVFQSGRLHS